MDCLCGGRGVDVLNLSRKWDPSGRKGQSTTSVGQVQERAWTVEDELTRGTSLNRFDDVIKNKILNLITYLDEELHFHPTA